MKNHFLLKYISFSSIVGIIIALLCCTDSDSKSSSEFYDEQFQEDLRNSGYLHFPLPSDYSKAYETFGLTKKVLVSDLLSDMEDLSVWTHMGIGGMSLTTERKIDGNHSLRLIAPTRIQPTVWIQGMPRVDDEYFGLGLGSSQAIIELGGVNWEKYNRLHFYIYPDCEGARTIYLNSYIQNDGVIKVPDEFGREGYHENNLKNRQWNECFLEITELSRDKVTDRKSACRERV